ncbi:MAG: hypothetical protein RL685_2585 [Pseudomonadota bacterium]|jgi:peptidylprolyl isomerase
MSFFRFALLGCALLGCSGSDEDPADEGTGGTQAAAGPQGAAGMPGLPGLDAPSDVAGPPADAETTSSGLASKRLVAGTGSVFPTAADTVRVHYTGWQTNGVRFDSSVARGSPATFPLNMVIRGWTEGLPLMVEGETRRFWIPDVLAYRGSPDRPQGTLVFDVQLLAIVPK